MRFAALLLTSLFTTVVGCAASSADGSATSSSDVTTACTAAYEDDAIVVYADHTYAAKQLHVTDMRITPANPSGTIDWEGSRFYESHVEYDLTPRVDDAALARARAAVGGELTPATIAIDASSASTQTLVTPGSSSFTTANGVLVAELTDHFEGPSSADSGPVIGASLRKSLLLGARAKAKAALAISRSRRRRPSRSTSTKRRSWPPASRCRPSRASSRSRTRTAPVTFERP